MSDAKSKQSKRGGARQGAGRKPGADRQSAVSDAVEKPGPAAHLVAYQFQPGSCPNPNGRPKGSRNKLGEAFLADFHEDWLEHGKAAIREVRETRPQDYLKAAVSILPKELKVTVGDYDELSEDELDRRIRALASAVSLEIRAGESAGGEEAQDRAQPASGVSTLQ